ncbi:MAG TPA: hypothetical protein V6C57_28465, partial [Coleofasciculaceae cyanobacterium]
MSPLQFQIEYRSMLVDLGFAPIASMRMAMDAAQEIKMATMPNWSDRALLDEITSTRRAIGLAAVYGLMAGFKRATE